VATVDSSTTKEADSGADRKEDQKLGGIQAAAEKPNHHSYQLRL